MSDSDSPDATDRDTTGTVPGDHPVDCGHFEDFDDAGVVPETLWFFGKKHTLAIMYEFAFSEEPMRFSEVETAVEVSSTTLSNRLSELVDRGFLTRKAYNEVPPRVEYEATEKTRALTPIFEDLYEWAGTYETEAETFEK